MIWTEERINQAVAMRENGKTYKEIGEAFGVTRQAVYDAMKIRNKTARRNKAVYKAIPYNGLRELFEKDESLTISKLAAILFPGQGRYYTAKRLCEGANVCLTVTQIKRLLKYSGMTYEHIFNKEENNED